MISMDDSSTQDSLIRISAVTRNPRLQAVLEKIVSGDTEFSNIQINDIILTQRQVNDYFLRMRTAKNGKAEQLIVGPWITALQQARAKKWAQRGLSYLEKQIEKLERSRNDPDHFGMFEDQYFDALLVEREKLLITRL